MAEIPVAITFPVAPEVVADIAAVDPRIRILDFAAAALRAGAEIPADEKARALATIAPRQVPWIMKRIREWRAATYVDLGGSKKENAIFRTVRFREGRWACAA